MAQDLARDGWDVAIHYNTSAGPAEELVTELSNNGVTAAAVGADLLDHDAIEGLVRRASDALGGRLTLLVNNASIFEHDRIATTTRASWDRAIDSNLYAPIMLTRFFSAQAPRARIDENGEPVAEACVVNMIDQRVLKPTPIFHSYMMAKSALAMFTRTAAQDLAPHIRVGAIGPGPTLIAEGESEEHFRRQRAACTLGRGPDTEDIVQALRFIIGNKAFTGQMLAIDGGQHLIWRTSDIHEQADD